MQNRAAKISDKNPCNLSMNKLFDSTDGILWQFYVNNTIILCFFTNFVQKIVLPIFNRSKVGYYESEGICDEKKYTGWANHPHEHYAVFNP